MSMRSSAAALAVNQPCLRRQGVIPRCTCFGLPRPAGRITPRSSRGKKSNRSIRLIRLICRICPSGCLFVRIRLYTVYRPYRAQNTGWAGASVSQPYRASLSYAALSGLKCHHQTVSVFSTVSNSRHEVPTPARSATPGAKRHSPACPARNSRGEATTPRFPACCGATTM